MVARFEPDVRKIDEEVSELIARHVEAHHRRDEEPEVVVEVSEFLKMAQPELDGDEQAAIDRLRAALIEAEHRTDS